MPCWREIAKPSILKTFSCSKALTSDFSQAVTLMTSNSFLQCYLIVSWQKTSPCMKPPKFIYQVECVGLQLQKVKTLHVRGYLLIHQVRHKVQINWQIWCFGVAFMYIFFMQVQVFQRFVSTMIFLNQSLLCKHNYNIWLKWKLVSSYFTVQHVSCRLMENGGL